MKVVCVLRSGGRYGPEHVRWLAGQLPSGSLVALSDVPIDGVDRVPLRHGWPGWWSKMELFSGAIDGDLLYIDLDSVIVGDIEALRRDQTTACSDFLRPAHVNSSVMWICEKDKRRVFDAFAADPDKHMREFRKWPARWGDQGFIESRLPGVARFHPRLVASYRVSGDAWPQSAVVVTFHGKRKPWDVTPTPWIPRLAIAQDPRVGAYTISA